METYGHCTTHGQETMGEHIIVDRASVLTRDGDLRHCATHGWETIGEQKQYLNRFQRPHLPCLTLEVPYAKNDYARTAADNRWSNMKIIQVIPTYNEAKNLPVLINALFTQEIPEFNVLIVDDNSPDGTGDVAEALAQDYPGRVSVLHRQGKEGLGKAYIQGFRYALDEGADVIGMMDADLSHPPDRLPALLSALADSDVVIGSRYVEGGSVDKEWPALRKALSWFGNTYARIILGLPIQDTTGGYRLWRRSALEAIPFESSRSNGYVFIVELAYMAKLAGLTFSEVPIYFAERTQGMSKMSLRIQIEAAFRVWQLKGMYKEVKPINKL